MRAILACVHANFALGLRSESNTNYQRVGTSLPPSVAHLAAADWVKTISIAASAATVAALDVASLLASPTAAFAAAVATAAADDRAAIAEVVSTARHALAAAALVAQHPSPAQS